MNKMRILIIGLLLSFIVGIAWFFLEPMQIQANRNCIGSDVDLTFSNEEINEMISLMNQRGDEINSLAASWGNNGKRVVVDLIIPTEENKLAFCSLFDHQGIFEFNHLVNWPVADDSSELLSPPLAVASELNNQVSMDIFSQDATSLSIIINNHSSYELLTGLDFSIELYQKGNWRVLPVTQNFVSLGLMVPKNGSLVMEKSLEPYLSLMEAGRYRIRKVVNGESWGEADDFFRTEAHDLVAEFYWD